MLKNKRTIFQFQYTVQRAMKVVSIAQGLVDFTLGLVNSILNLPAWQVKLFLRNYNHKRIVINPAHHRASLD